MTQIHARACCGGPRGWRMMPSAGYVQKRIDEQVSSSRDRVVHAHVRLSVTATGRRNAQQALPSIEQVCQCRHCRCGSLCF